MFPPDAVAPVMTSVRDNRVNRLRHAVRTPNDPDHSRQGEPTPRMVPHITIAPRTVFVRVRSVKPRYDRFGMSALCRAKPAAAEGCDVMQFRSVAQLGRCIRANLWRIPRDVDLIVSVPRSGMMPGILIANALNLPHLTLDDFLAGREAHQGRRMGNGRSAPQKALVLDDSVATGAENVRIRALLSQAKLDCRYMLGAIYVAPRKQDLVDVHFEIVEEPRMFEWNMANHYLLRDSCVDIDGVLCRDPTLVENDDGPAYREFIDTVEPLLRPGAKIGWLVTSRLEGYREQTERWLAKHGVQYGELCMLDLPSKAERQRLRAHGSFKAKVYNSTPSKLFIESEESQAWEILEASGKPVLCVSTAELLQPGQRQIALGKARRLPWSVPRSLKSRIRQLITT
jgi:uncharacterized HAD superfamily protein